MSKKKKGYLNKELINLIIVKDLEGVSNVDIEKQLNVNAATICMILNYYRGKNNAYANKLSENYKEIIDKIKGTKPIETKKITTVKKVYLFGLFTIEKTIH